MPDQVSGLMARIRELEDELEAELARRRAEFRYSFEKRKVVFEEAILREHKALKRRLWPYIRAARPMVIVTAPVIYALIVPLVLLDLFVSLYQAICFPVYGIEKVRRADFIAIDRRYLAYLNGLEKLNCIYCGYANGLIAYVAEIAGRTERYWCPIKHARRLAATHAHYPEFAEYGDASGYHRVIGRAEPSLPGESGKPGDSGEGQG